MEHINNTRVSPYWDDRGHRNEGDEEEEEEEDDDDGRLGQMGLGTHAELAEDTEEEEFCTYFLG